MKQTVEEAAKEYAELIVKPQEMYLSFEGVYSLKEDLFNSFSAGAEWKSRQSPWISVKERLPEQTSLSFAEWYQMERLLVVISLFHPGDRHTLRQTEDLNLRIGTTTSVTCGCPFRLLMKYSKPIRMYLNGLKRKEIEI